MTKCPILAYWNGFISTVKLGHQCGRSTTPVGKKIQAEGTKATQENVAKFPVSPQRRIVGLTVKNTKAEGKQTAHTHCK